VKIPAPRKSVAAYLTVLATVLLLASTPRAQQPPSSSAPPTELSLALDPQQSTIHWTLDSTLHTVHGTFLLKRGNVHVDSASGKATGEIVVVAASGESANDSRDKKMHQEILESGKYPEITFRPDRIDGRLPANGSWTATIHGTFALHGAEHELTVPIQGEFSGDHWKGTAKFTIPYIQWGLKNPSNFLLKVNPEVDVELDMAGAMQLATAK
jgi:polyisoprenoid-binding protein YceI